jgi:hypothetical protein
MKSKLSFGLKILNFYHTRCFIGNPIKKPWKRCVEDVESDAKLPRECCWNYPMRFHCLLNKVNLYILVIQARNRKSEEAIQNTNLEP